MNVAEEMTASSQRRCFDSAPCIWCGAATFDPSLEHILPEALGCPPGFVLSNDVCAKCNNGFGHLDRALLRQFELITFLGNVPRKRGKAPSLDSWSSILGRYTEAGPELHINGGPGPAEAFGKRLKPAQATKDLENLSFKATDGFATVKFSQRFGDDPKFVRALYKVAFGVAVYWLGPAVASTPEMAAVKKFVRKGRGEFSAVLIAGSGRHDHHFEPPYREEDTAYLAVGMRIFGIDFVTDFDPGQRLTAKMETLLTAKRHQNWTILPPCRQGCFALQSRKSAVSTARRSRFDLDWMRVRAAARTRVARHLIEDRPSVVPPSDWCEVGGVMSGTTALIRRSPPPPHRRSLGIASAEFQRILLQRT
ncbi:HNH endonuclease [Mesorhizobium caraganae]|uniref:HNH endonuclease n=1 Tax=Mesorhizobium caraganae TaxID=483206 RepID=UPI00177FA02E|nr:HNH endonuclease [Mesorhizobium caraganae]